MSYPRCNNALSYRDEVDKPRELPGPTNRSDRGELGLLLREIRFSKRGGTRYRLTAFSFNVGLSVWIWLDRHESIVSNNSFQEEVFVTVGADCVPLSVAISTFRPSSVVRHPVSVPGVFVPNRQGHHHRGKAKVPLEVKISRLAAPKTGHRVIGLVVGTQSAALELRE